MQSFTLGYTPAWVPDELLDMLARSQRSDGKGGGGRDPSSRQRPARLAETSVERRVVSDVSNW